MDQWVFVLYILLPTINFLAFLNMVRKDTERTRRSFYFVLLAVTLGQFVLMMVNMVIETSEHLRREHCIKHAHDFYCSPGYIWLVTIEDIAVGLLSIYFIFVVRQHWYNMRDARGDNFGV